MSKRPTAAVQRYTTRARKLGLSVIPMPDGTVHIVTTDDLANLLTNTERTSDGCLLWTGKIYHEQGYGTIHIGGQRIMVHRFVFMLATGRPIPAGGRILHSCGNLSCWHPDHLRLKAPKRPRGDQKPDPSLTQAEHFTALYAAYRYRVAAYIQTRVRQYDGHLVDDLVTDTFVQVWRAMDRYHQASDRQTFSWLATIANYRVVSHYRLLRNAREFPCDPQDWQFNKVNLAPSYGGTCAPVRNGWHVEELETAS